MSNCGPSKRNSADSKSEWTDWKRSWTAIRISQVPGYRVRPRAGPKPSRRGVGVGGTGVALPPQKGSPLAQCDSHGPRTPKKIRANKRERNNEAGNAWGL